MRLLPGVNLRHFTLLHYAGTRLVRLGRLLLVFRPIVWRSAGGSTWYWTRPRGWVGAELLDDMDRVRWLVEAHPWRVAWGQ